MKVLEVRRHSLTMKGPGKGLGSHLSQAGVNLAKSVGAEMSTFDRVVTSSISRTAETAIAMGFAVDEIVEDLCPSGPRLYSEIGHQERWQWHRPFEVFAELITGGGATAELGSLQAEIWKGILAALPDEGRALVVSHGRVIESGLVSLIRADDYESWGSPFHHCEGVRIRMDDGLLSHEFLRVGRSEFWIP